MPYEKILLILLTLGQGIWAASWAIGRWTQRQETSNLELHRRLTVLEAKPDSVILSRDLEAAHKRMDQAGKAMSDLASDIQSIESRFRAIFVSREILELELNEGRVDRKHLWDAVDQLKRQRNSR